MTKILSFAACASLITLLAACAVDKKIESSAAGAGTGSAGGGGGGVVESSNKLSYEFSVNGCETGKKEFSDADAAKAKSMLCAGLQNDDFNNHCAETTRKAYFRQNCAGQKWKGAILTDQPTPEEQTLIIDEQEMERDI